MQKITLMEVQRDRHLGQYDAWATAFLINYQGTFDYLVRAKALQAEGVPLTDGYLKGVLNCMRNDHYWGPALYSYLTKLNEMHGHVRNLDGPNPIIQVREERRTNSGFGFWDTVQANGAADPLPEPPKEKVRPYCITIKVNWKAPFIYTTFRPAQVCHILHVKKSEVRYKPHEEKYQYWMRTLCTPYFGSNEKLAIELAHHVPNHLKLCKRCVQINWDQAGENSLIPVP